MVKALAQEQGRVMAINSSCDACVGFGGVTFAAGDINDWSTNDWLCVRVLETVPIRYPMVIERLMGWVDADSLWQRRSAYLPLKKRKDRSLSFGGRTADKAPIAKSRSIYSAGGRMGLIGSLPSVRAASRTAIRDPF